MPMNFECTDPQYRPHTYTAGPFTITKDGVSVDVMLELDERLVNDMAQRAIASKGGKRTVGPLTAKVVKKHSSSDRFHVYCRHSSDAYAQCDWLKFVTFPSRRQATKYAQDSSADHSWHCIVIPSYSLYQSPAPDRLSCVTVEKLLSLAPSEVKAHL